MSWFLSPSETFATYADERAIPQARERACINGSDEGARFLAAQHRRAALGDDVPRPAHRVRRVRVDDLADDEPVKQHAYRRQVLLYGRFGESHKKTLHIASDMHRLHVRQVAYAALRAELRKLAGGVVLSPARVLVANVRGEEVEEALRRPSLFEEQGRGLRANIGQAVQRAEHHDFGG